MEGFCQFRVYIFLDFLLVQSIGLLLRFFYFLIFWNENEFEEILLFFFLVVLVLFFLFLRFRWQKIKFCGNMYRFGQFKFQFVCVFYGDIQVGRIKVWGQSFFRLQGVVFCFYTYFYFLGFFGVWVGWWVYLIFLNLISVIMSWGIKKMFVICSFMFIGNEFKVND